MFDEQNKTNGYGQSDTGYGQSDTYHPPVQPKAPEEPTPAVEPEILSSATVDEQPTEPVKAEIDTANGAEQPQAPNGQSGGYQGQQPYGQNSGYQGQQMSGQQNGTYYAPDGTPKTGYQGQPYGSQNGGYQGQQMSGQQNGGYQGQSYYGGQPPYQSRDVYSQPFPRNEKDTFGVLSLVCGIFSIVTCCCGGLASVVLGIFAIVFACMSKSRHFSGQFTTAAKAGLIVGIIGIVFGVFVLLVGFMIPEEVMQEIINEYEQSMTGYPDGWDV